MRIHGKEGSSLNDFEIDLPNKNELIVNATDKSLYPYDFSSFSLLPLHQTASFTLAEKIKNKLYANVSQTSLINEMANKGETEYVAKLSDYAKEKLNTGEWSLGIRKKTGETYAVIKDSVSGKSQSFVTLDKKIVQDLGILPQLSAIQGQLASLAEQIEILNRMVQRVEQGQYNDRFAGFFSARQLIIEGMATQDDFVSKELLISAIKINNETIGKLMFSIHYDSGTLLDVKTKPKDAARINNFLQSSIRYLNSSVQLNLIAYTALGEQDALYSTLTNYQSFIEQKLLSLNGNEKTVAWLLDNGQKGDKGRIVELAQNVTDRIIALTNEYHQERIEVTPYEKKEIEREQREDLQSSGM